MNKRTFSYGLNFGLIAILALLVLRSNTASDLAPIASKPKPAAPDVEQVVHGVPLPQSLSFAGQAVPLADANVRERLDRELLVNTYWHSNTIRSMKLADKYFPVIEPILAKYGIPDDFKYLAVIESGLMNVTSPAGAKGIWQFMPATAKEYNLEVANEVDERYHLEKATVAACKYLANSFRSFNDWALTAAAYNAGKSRISKLMNTQRADNYYDLYLTSETERYVFRILAAKLILSNPQRYGFYIDGTEQYQPVAYRTESVTSIADIPAYAQQKGVTYKALKLLNPWLRSTKLTERKSKKSYEIKIPL